MTRSVLRGLLWGILAMTLFGVLLAWWRSAPGSSAPLDLPVLAELPPFELVERSGRVVQLDDFAGSPWIVDFIFTRCAATCPRMTSQMRRLGSLLPGGVRRVSITVDPDYDSLEVLRSYAQAYGINDEDWWFLRGEKDETRELVRRGFQLAVGEAAEGAAEPILHSERFVLVDAQGRVRGYYDAFEEDALDELARAATQLQQPVATPGGMS